jgi:hypothetical protein
MYEVRLATEEDVTWVVEVAATKMLIEELGKPQYVNSQHIKTLVHTCIATKSIWIVLKNEVRIGCLAAFVVPNLFNPSITCLTEVMWWVDEEHRTGRAGLLLLKAFMDEADNYDEATMSLLTTSDVFNHSLEKRGFILREFGFHKE